MPILFFGKLFLLQGTLVEVDDEHTDQGQHT